MRLNPVLLLLVLTGCARTPAPTPPRPNPPVNPQAVAARWQYPNATVVSGGFTAGLYHTSFRSDAKYEEVWEFYARLAGFAPKFNPEARAVEGECTSGPEPCSAHAVESHNGPGFRSASFALRGPQGAIVAAIWKAESEKQTRVQLTIAAP